MKNILIAFSISFFIFSCTKKDEATKPKEPWVQLYSLGNQVNGIKCLRDTFVVSCNITESEYTMPYFYTGVLTDHSSGILGHVGPPHGNTMITSYGNGLYVGTFGSGVYYSKDLCQTWEPKNNGITGVKFIFDIVDTDKGLYACSEKIFFSDDKGESWTNISIPTMVNAATLIGVENTLFASVRTNASTENIVFRSIDNGENWLLKENMPEGSIYKFAYMNEMLYAVSANNNTSEVYVSANKGNTWTKGNGLNSFGGVYFSCFESYNGTVYVGGSNGVYKSTDNGLNWTSIGSKDVTAMVRKDNILYVGNLKGIYERQL